MLDYEELFNVEALGLSVSNLATDHFEKCRPYPLPSKIPLSRS